MASATTLLAQRVAAQLVVEEQPIHIRQVLLMLHDAKVPTTATTAATSSDDCSVEEGRRFVAAEVAACVDKLMAAGREHLRPAQLMTIAMELRGSLPPAFAVLALHAPGGDVFARRRGEVWCCSPCGVGRGDEPATTWHAVYSIALRRCAALRLAKSPAYDDRMTFGCWVPRLRVAPTSVSTETLVARSLKRGPEKRGRDVVDVDALEPHAPSRPEKGHGPKTRASRVVDVEEID